MSNRKIKCYLCRKVIPKCQCCQCDCFNNYCVDCDEKVSEIRDRYIMQCEVCPCAIDCYDLETFDEKLKHIRELLDECKYGKYSKKITRSACECNCKACYVDQ